MANSAQARKRARQNIKQHLHNASLRTAFRTAVKKVIKAIDSADQATAMQVYRQTTSVIDRIADKGAYHKNKAIRHKSRLAARIKVMSSPS